MSRSEKCHGCQHDRPSSTDYCYMFEAEPVRLPCGQHDKYKHIRQETGKLMRKHPMVLQLLVLESLMKGSD